MGETGRHRGKTPVVPRQPLELTHLSFSPDGEYVYFARRSPHGRDVHSLPRPGPRRPRDANSRRCRFARQFLARWARVRVPARRRCKESHIVVAAAGGGSQRILATRKSPLSFSLFAPDWSPDGKMVAAAVIDRSNTSRSIVLLSVDDGSSRELYRSDWSTRPSPLAAGRIGAADRHVGRVERRIFGRLPGGAIWRIGTQAVGPYA